MKKLITSACCLLFISIQVFAQSNAAEAKAAYLLAEEEFNAGKYESAITYLNQATEKLGAANAKILYLKILALQQLAEKEDKMFPNLQEAIDAFEKADDSKNFNEEKKIEITKLKLQVARKVALIPTNKLEIAAWVVMRVKGWKLGMTLDELKGAHPGFFSEVKPQSFEEGKVHYIGTYNGVTLLLILQMNKLKEAGMVVEFISDNKTFEKGKDGWQKVNASLVSRFGTNTNDTITTSPVKEASNAFVRTASWVSENRQLSLVHTGNNTAKAYTSIIELKIKEL